MSAILGTSVTGAGAAGAYAVNNSLRFRRDASPFLNRTPASAGNGTTWTWSGWVKRGVVSNVNLNIFGAGWSGSGWLDAIRFTDNFGFQYAVANTGGFVGQLRTTQLFRDPSAWYHIVCVWDTTQATASERMRLFINGSRVTALSTANYPSQNQSTTWINQTQVHRIGSEAYLSGGDYYDGQMAEMYFIDGQALNASSFGDTNASTGVWQPKAYVGSYGTNGFYLKFSDIATTSGSNTGLGRDFSGNSNYWTTNNISVTPGATYDALTDSPTPVSSTVGNFSVFNPVAPASQTLSNANLQASTASTAAIPSTVLASSGKWYAEIALVSGTFHRVGVCNVNGIARGLGDIADGWAYLSDGRVYNNGVSTSYGVSSTNGDIINVALDLDAGRVWYGKNGTWMASGNPATNSNPSQTFTANQTMAFAVASGSGTIVYTGNFGQRPFAYTPPAGFNRLQTFNLPTPTIGASATTLAGKYMNVLTYTGNSATSSAGTVARTLTGLGFQPDLIWVKSRNNGGTWSDHSLTDSVRGANLSLSSNTFGGTINVTTTFSAGGVGSGSADGFTIVSGTDGITTNLNSSSGTYVGWCWKANGAGSTNTAGSITSTASVNQTARFSIVTYTGNQTSGATVGHGLGAAPAMIIIKQRNVDRNWFVGHTSIGWTRYFEGLNRTNAAATSSAVWNNTAPTSTVFTLGNEVGVNDGGGSYVAYCFAPVTGYSAFGSYTGNGSNDGTFIYTGFRPEYIMIKRTDSASNWTVIDVARYPINTTGPDNPLRPNTSEAETGGSDRFALGDILSNGFKLRYFDSSTNVNGGTYIYMAFAENPFNYSLAR